MPASQAGRRRFDPGLPLQKISNLAKPVPPCTPLYSVSELTAMFRAGSLRPSDPTAGEALLAWMRANHASIPAGESEQTIMIGGSVSLKVKFKSDDSRGDMGY